MITAIFPQDTSVCHTDRLRKIGGAGRMTTTGTTELKEAEVNVADADMVMVDNTTEDDTIMISSTWAPGPPKEWPLCAQES